MGRLTETPAPTPSRRRSAHRRLHLTRPLAARSVAGKVNLVIGHRDEHLSLDLDSLLGQSLHRDLRVQVAGHSWVGEGSRLNNASKEQPGSFGGCGVVAELALGASCLLARSQLSYILSLVGALGLLLMFTGWMVGVLRAGLKVNCACFGNSSSTVSTRTVTRNSALIMATTAALAAVINQPITTDPAIAGIAPAVTLAALASFFAAFRFVRPYLISRSDVYAAIAKVQRN